MSPLTLIGVAFGLAMDAFAVSMGVGIVLRRVNGRQTFRLAWHFGLFQALMPVVGWLAGMSVERWIAPVAGWVAFLLLGGIGGKMIYEALRHRDDGEERRVADPTRGVPLVILSVATSIDALAVGLSMGLLRQDVWYPALVIGAVAGAMTVLGLQLGRRFGALLGRRMEVVGGVVLVGIGVRILVEHLTA